MYVAHGWEQKLCLMLAINKQNYEWFFENIVKGKFWTPGILDYPTKIERMLHSVISQHAMSGLESESHKL